MSDTRIRVETTKTVRLGQLDAALGGHGLVAGDGVIVAVEGSPVTEAEFAVAIEAHIPEPEPPSPAERLAALESRMDRAANGAPEEAVQRAPTYATPNDAYPYPSRVRSPVNSYSL